MFTYPFSVSKQKKTPSLDGVFGNKKKLFRNWTSKYDYTKDCFALKE